MLDALIVLTNGTRIGRTVESIPDSPNIRYRMGREYVTAEPTGDTDADTKLPIYREAADTRESLPEDDYLRIEADEATERRASAKPLDRVRARR